MQLNIWYEFGIEKNEVNGNRTDKNALNGETTVKN